MAISLAFKPLGRPSATTAVSLFFVSGVRELWRDLGRSGRAGVVSGAVALLLFVPLLLVGPLARSALSSRAAERGLTTEIETVRLGLRGLWLCGVTLESAPPSRVTARLDAVLVPFGGGSIEVHGGRLVLRGTPSEVNEALSVLTRHWRWPLELAWVSLTPTGAFAGQSGSVKRLPLNKP
jgi:hypothetical protein